MDTQTAIINKDNWTGEMGEVAWEPATGSFTVEGLADGPFLLDNPESSEPGIYRVRRDGISWFGYHCGKIVLFSFCGCQREDINPYLAFAKLAWNII